MSSDGEMSSMISPPQPTSLDLERVKQKLKRKTELLEGFLLDQISSMEACWILSRRTRLVEDEISKAGISEAAVQWLKHAGFDAESPSPPPRPWNHETTPNSQSRATGALESIGMGVTQPIELDIHTSKKRPLATALDIDPLQHAVPDRPNGVQSTPRKDGMSLPSLLVTSPVFSCSVPPLPKRIKLSPEENLPCLRCKILKKKCDSLQLCANCPQQSYSNGNDYWKVLGCFRGPLQNLTSVFCPDFETLPSRILKLPSGGSQPIDIILLKSQMSATKKMRVLLLIKLRDDFFQLADSSWENPIVRKSLSREVAGTHELAGRSVLNETSCVEEHEAAWALLQVVAMDADYLRQTEFNPFTLIRFGNKFLNQDPGTWEIFRKAKALLRQAVEIFLLESLCKQIASGTLSGPAPFCSSKLPGSKALVLVDIKGCMEDFLRSFEEICSGRAKLEGAAQLSCFYALLVFSIVKSILIDAYAARSFSDYNTLWNQSYALRITSAFKAMAGIFTSSSKSDVILQVESSDGSSNALHESRELVHMHQWEEHGFKTSKDFLLSLGSFLVSGGSYNGFFTQKLGLDAIPKYSSLYSRINVSDKTSKTPSTDGKSNMTHTFSVEANPTSIARRELSPNSAKTLSPEPDHHGQSTDNPSDNDSLSGSSKGRRTSSFTFVSYSGVSNRDHCRRRGPLDGPTVKRARDVRKVGACWNCWLMKVPCSLGDPCDRCQKNLSHSPMRACSRAPLSKLTEAFFPEFINSHLDATVMNTYIADNVSSITGESFLVEVTLLGDRPLKLLASAFIPNFQAWAQQKYQGRSGQFLCVESLPIGLFPLEVSTIKHACLTHLDCTLEDPLLPDLLSGYRSRLSKQVLKAVCSLYQSTKHPLMHDVLLFYLISEAMARPILFTESSAAVIVERLAGDYSGSKYFSSRLLNRQIKRVVHMAGVDLLKQILGQLEKILRSRQGFKWSIAFSSFLVLCLCIEQIESQAEAHITSLKSSSLLPDHLVAEPQLSCWSLENIMFSQFVPIFHAVYRTHNGGLNPLGKDLAPFSDEQLDEPSLALIKTIRAIEFDDHLLQKHSSIQGFGKGQQEFTKSNSGRLIARFLTMFNDQRSVADT